MAAGANFSLGVGEDGKAYGWGWNAQGSLGDGTLEDRHLPTAVDAGDLTFTELSAGSQHAIGLTDDGRVYSWGPASSGRTGNGETSGVFSSPVAANTPETERFVQVEAGRLFSVALTEGGDVYGWGSNSSGQLGNGETASAVAEPVRANRPEGVKFVKVSAGERHLVALGDDGKVYAWGGNNYGQLGLGVSDATVLAPTAVDFGGDVVIRDVIASESHHTLALLDDGSVYAWGRNNNGQLGDGTQVDSSAPLRVPLPDGVALTGINAGRDYSVGITADGRTFVWGTNRLGTFGNGESGTGVISASPLQVAQPEGVIFTAIASGVNQGLALGDNGKTYGWGTNANGQVGDGSAVDQLTPVEVALPLAYAPAETPELLSAEVTGSSLVVSWSDVAAESYRVRLQSGDTDPVFVEVTGGATSTVIDSLVPGDYEVSVAAGNWVGAGRYSAPKSVSVVGPTTVTATASPVVYGKTGKVAVRVSPAGATGSVSVRVGAKTYRAEVKNGTASIALPARVQGAGTASLPVAFVPSDAHYLASSSTVKLTVAKARSKSISVSGKRFTKGTTPRVTVRVGKLDNGAYPVGKVRVQVGSAKKTVSLSAAKKGTVTVKLTKKYRKSFSVTATFLPKDAKNVAKAASKKTKVRVR
nr:hypothetical protein [Leucobacter weissii]